MKRRLLPAVGALALVVATWATLTKPLLDGRPGVVLICAMFAVCVGGLMTAAHLLALPICGTCGGRMGDEHYDDFGWSVCPDADGAPVDQWEVTSPVGFAERDAAASARAGEVGRGWRR